MTLHKELAQACEITNNDGATRLGAVRVALR